MRDMILTVLLNALLALPFFTVVPPGAAARRCGRPARAAPPPAPAAPRPGPLGLRGLEV